MGPVGPRVAWVVLPTPGTSGLAGGPWHSRVTGSAMLDAGGALLSRAWGVMRLREPGAGSGENGGVPWDGDLCACGLAELRRAWQQSRRLGLGETIGSPSFSRARAWGTAALRACLRTRGAHAGASTVRCLKLGLEPQGSAARLGAGVGLDSGLRELRACASATNSGPGYGPSSSWVLRAAILTGRAPCLRAGLRLMERPAKPTTTRRRLVESQGGQANR